MQSWPTDNRTFRALEYFAIGPSLTLANYRLEETAKTTSSTVTKYDRSIETIATMQLILRY